MNPALPPSASKAAFQPYESARSILKGEDWIFLDANESAYPGITEVPAIPRINRYPDPTSDALRDAIALFYGLRRENLLIGNGSDELIDLCVRAFVRLGRSVLSTTPTYGMYRVSAGQNQREYVSVPLDSTFQFDADVFIREAKNSDVLFLCNPNNPTGTVFGLDLLERLLDSFPGLVVVDEAYGEFSDAAGIPSAIDLVKKGRKNLIVLRTFSKAFGAAGLRLGYGLSDPSIIRTLLTMKPPYNVNTVSQALGLSLWKDRATLKRNVQLLVSERRRLMSELERFGCEVLPSATNFFLVVFPLGVKSDELYVRLRDDFRIVVRRITSLVPRNMLRITVGTPQENDMLLNALSVLL